MNLRNEIPQRAFINAQIVQNVEVCDSWNESIEVVSKNYNLEHYQFMNPAYVVSLLYCLLIVPKEIWIKNNKQHIIFSEIDTNELKNRILSYSSSKPDFESNFTYNFMHSLRNSIAHANFEIDENMNFKFWDEYKERENFSCQLNKENLMWLLSIIGSKMANLRVKT